MSIFSMVRKRKKESTKAAGRSTRPRLLGQLVGERGLISSALLLNTFFCLFICISRWPLCSICLDNLTPLMIPDLHMIVMQYHSLKELGAARIAGMITAEEQLQAIAHLIVSNMNLDDSLDGSPLYPLLRAIKKGTFSTSDARGMALKEHVRNQLFFNLGDVVAVKNGSIVEHLLRDRVISAPHYPTDLIMEEIRSRITADVSNQGEFDARTVLTHMMRKHRLITYARIQIPLMLVQPMV
jgi:hypothetical protein